MATKKTTTATKTAAAKMTAKKKPFAKKQSAKTTKATAARKPSDTKTDAKKKLSQIDAALYAAILRDLRKGKEARSKMPAPSRFTNAYANRPKR